jgi:rubrerythrin
MIAKGNLERLFELAIALEHATEVFYRGLAVKFSGDLELEQFWSRFAAEEAGHARWLEDLLKKTKESNNLKLQEPAPKKLLQAARDLLHVSPRKTLESITNLDEAYQGAIAAESSETNIIFEFLVADFAFTSQSRLFLTNQLKNHADRTAKEFPERYNSVSARLACKADQ